jgi:hypothetical protein
MVEIGQVSLVLAFIGAMAFVLWRQRYAARNFALVFTGWLLFLAALWTAIFSPPGAFDHRGASGLLCIGGLAGTLITKGMLEQRDRETG